VAVVGRRRLRANEENALSRHLSMLRAAALCAALTLAFLGASASAQQEEIALVRVDPVRSEPLVQTAPVIGRLVARQAGNVAARVGGPVDSFLVEVGDRVEAGQVIARLDATTLSARRALAAARLASAEAQATTERAELALARQELKRLERLRSSAAFNQARHEDQSQAVIIAEAELAHAQSQIDMAITELQLAEIDHRYAEVRALYDGVITRRLSEAGAYVDLGEPLVSMIADADLEIEVDVPFRLIAGLTPGTEVALSLADGSRHSARVRAIVPDENPLTRTRAVRLTAVFVATERPLAPGQSATVEVPLGEARRVLTVSKDAVIPGAQAAMVFVVVENRAEPRRVELGEAVGGRFEVLDGLSEGELTVVRGNERLRPGAPVRINGRVEDGGGTG
jgi:RND family efflux transporter MFP subunit